MDVRCDKQSYRSTGYDQSAHHLVGVRLDHRVSVPLRGARLLGADEPGSDPNGFGTQGERSGNGLSIGDSSSRDTVGSKLVLNHL